MTVLSVLTGEIDLKTHGRSFSTTLSSALTFLNSCCFFSSSF